MQALTSNSYEEISAIVEQLEEELDWFRDTVRTEAASRNREINMDEGDCVRRTMHKGAEAINSLTANLDRMEARRVKRELETRSPTARHATMHPLRERPATPRPSHESNSSSRAIPSPPDTRPNVQQNVGAQIDPVQMPIAELAPIPIAARQPPFGLPGLPHPPPTGDYRMERIHPYTSALRKNARFVWYFPVTGQTGAENANAVQDHSITARTGGAAPADEQGSRRGAEPPPAPVNTPMDQIPTQRSGIGHLGPAEWTQYIGDTVMVSDWQTDPVIQRSIGKLFAPRQPNEDQATFDGRVAAVQRLINPPSQPTPRNRQRDQSQHRVRPDEFTVDYDAAQNGRNIGSSPDHIRPLKLEGVTPEVPSSMQTLTSNQNSHNVTREASQASVHSTSSQDVNIRRTVATRGYSNEPQAIGTVAHGNEIDGSTIRLDQTNDYRTCMLREVPMAAIQAATPPMMVMTIVADEVMMTVETVLLTYLQTMADNLQVALVVTAEAEAGEEAEEAQKTLITQGAEGAEEIHQEEVETLLGMIPLMTMEITMTIPGISGVVIGSEQLLPRTNTKTNS
ncbi:hypothetical protein GLOTRDRAFT_129014 [Gloeophyllum trabeum ATCC 11539]|uniref:Uncharacterized protein n=1 Tax=Gloeophyllum trabeum (strain ATCC 11539 / FP-39264 / Madison 617) TaxID=670483 RepID=S7Q8P6_GLOTA|nr:uncharacterized protein GLOTRDRAFT_129014 [Gloeophyllum trabeum ATCC 11539]EPQ55798.1 hypothetical protein GLOTRDRAFT_129014 [Gloeophyllum trabeum ATCC 11539]